MHLNLIFTQIYFPLFFVPGFLSAGHVQEIDRAAAHLLLLFRVRHKSRESQQM